MRKTLKRQAELKRVMEEGEALALSKKLIPQILMQQQQHQGDIDVTKPESFNTQMIYVDNKMMMENQLGMEDLMRMAEQPHKFRLSNYLRNKVAKERARRE